VKLFAVVAFCSALCPPLAARAAGAGLACFDRRPEPDSVRALRITAHDQADEKTVLIVRLYGRRNQQGLGQLFLRIEKPDAMRGTSLLMLQRENAESDIYLASPQQPTPRAIHGAEREQDMFGTDFSYEDLERVQYGWLPGEATIVELPAEPVNDRPAYVVEVKPHHSVWERIVFSLDEESCRPVWIRFFEPGKTAPSKELTTSFDSHVKHGDIWVAHSALMRDRVHFTTSHLMVDSHTQEALLPDDGFSVEGLARAVRGEAKPAP